jgi:hypothetical protein
MHVVSVNLLAYFFTVSICKGKKKIKEKADIGKKIVWFLLVGRKSDWKNGYFCIFRFIGKRGAI